MSLLTRLTPRRLQRTADRPLPLHVTGRSHLTLLAASSAVPYGGGYRPLIYTQSQHEHGQSAQRLWQGEARYDNPGDAALAAEWHLQDALAALLANTPEQTDRISRLKML